MTKIIYTNELVIFKDQHELKPINHFNFVKRFDPQAPAIHGMYILGLIHNFLLQIEYNWKICISGVEISLEMFRVCFIRSFGEFLRVLLTFALNLLGHGTLETVRTKWKGEPTLLAAVIYPLSLLTYRFELLTKTYRSQRMSSQRLQEYVWLQLVTRAKTITVSRT